MSFPAVSGRRRRSRDWLQMDDTIPTSDAPAAGFLPVIIPVLVDGVIYEVNYELPMPSPDDDRRMLDEMWRQRRNLNLDLYGLNRKRARGPASSGDDAIQRLLREARAGDAGMPEECAVCLQDFDADAKETLRVMPSCSHAFHPDCIFTWLRVKAVCPLCRLALPTQQHSKDQDFEDEDDSDDSDSDDSDSDEDENHQESTPAVPDPEES